MPLLGGAPAAGVRFALALGHHNGSSGTAALSAFAPIRAPDEGSAAVWNTRTSSSISCSRSGPASWAHFSLLASANRSSSGYILAGIAIGPYTPGFVAAELTVTALADIGIILLMFAIGVELSLAELLRSGKVAILGTIVQMLAIIGIGCGVGLLLGWRPLESLFFGAVISISSSTVLVKIIGDPGEIDSPHGRLTLAWSTVQDLATVILIVVLSAMATDSENLVRDVAWEVTKASLFLLLLIPLGLRVLPWIFDWIAELRSREVFVLSVGVAALGLAYGATFFGLSLALGAFVAGIVVGESDLSHQILGDIMPLRDIFAGLFFVSVGMLVDPGFVARHLPLLALTVLLIMVVKGSVSALIALVMKTPARTAILTGALLAVSAEFSFLLARVGHVIFTRRAIRFST